MNRLLASLTQETRLGILGRALWSLPLIKDKSGSATVPGTGSFGHTVFCPHKIQIDKEVRQCTF